MRFPVVGKLGKGWRGGITPVLLASLPFLVAACGEEDPPPKETIRAIEYFVVNEPAKGQRRQFSGSIEAAETSQLSFQVSGNVQTIKSELGDRVKRGQVLAILDSESFRLKTAQAQADLKKADAELEEAREDFRRQTSLKKEGVVPQANVDRARNRLESAESSVRAAGAALRLAQRDLRNTTLTAPFNGVIAKRHVDPFIEVTAGQPIFDLETEGKPEIAMNIPEGLVNQIKVGQEIAVRIPALNYAPGRARISKIGSRAGEANAFPVELDLIDLPPNVRSGMTVELDFIFQVDQQPAYLIPLNALLPADKPLSRETSGKVDAYVLKFDKKTSTVKRSRVKPRNVRDNFVEIIEGLSAGDIVASAGVHHLHDGQKVRLLKR
jgi:RND family efflux transporter MFP subunit